MVHMCSCAAVDIYVQQLGLTSFCPTFRPRHGLKEMHLLHPAGLKVLEDQLCLLTAHLESETKRDRLFLAQLDRAGPSAG